jgi:MFS family permease
MEASHNRTLNLFLFCCIFLFVCTEVLLSPFYPQFFEKVYGVTDPDKTGFYIMTCRLAVVLFTPIWGWIANRYQNSSTLLLIGQWGTGLSCFIMAMSPTFGWFAAASFLLLIFKSSYFLLYTLLMEQNSQKKTCVASRYHAVLQGAIIIATLLSGWVIALENPLFIFWVIGSIECSAGLAGYFLLKKAALKKDSSEKEEVRERQALPSLIKFGIVVLTLHIAVNMIRPFFTIYTESVYNVDAWTSSFLYLIPSLMAVASLPLIQKYSNRLGWNGYIGAAFLMIAGLYFQGIETSLTGFIIFRSLFGIGAAWCLAKLDVFVFQSSENAHKDYSRVSSIQNIGLLLAPVAASSIVTHRSLTDVFIYASLFVVLHVIVFIGDTHTKERAHIHKEEKHAISK